MPLLPRPVFAGLVFSLPVLITTLAVVMGFYLILHLAGDGLGARILFGVGLGALILLVINVVLVVCVLSLDALENQTDSLDDPDVNELG